MAEGKKGLIGMLFPEGGAKFRDDKGAFRGGVEGKVFGGARDFLSNIAAGGKEKRARKFAKSFDPSSESHVLKMQKLLNAAGITDLAGEGLAEDGIFGNKTLSALRRLQGIPGYNKGSSISENKDALWNEGGESLGPIEEPAGYEDMPEGWQAPMAADYDPNEDEGSTIFGRKGLFKDNKYWPF